MLSVFPPVKASWGMVVLAIFNFQIGVTVAMPREPVKKEAVVPVASKFPIVKLLLVVAISVSPAELETTMELAANAVALVPPFETGTVPKLMAPPPVRTS